MIRGTFTWGEHAIKVPRDITFFRVGRTLHVYVLTQSGQNFMSTTPEAVRMNLYQIVMTEYFHEPIDRQTLLHGWLIRCHLKLAFPKEEDE